MLLEVIVTSAGEALEAEEGGADRLELITAPELAGLTPAQATVEEVLKAVSIPVRVMLRDQPTMSIGNASEFTHLLATVERFVQLPIDGVVAGFNNGGGVDEQAMRQLAAAACGKSITFHRAFDVVSHQQKALEFLKAIPQVDRVLTRGCPGTWSERVAAVDELQSIAAPEIRIIFAAGKAVDSFAEIGRLAPGVEVHVGRAAREPATFAGKVTRARVMAVKRALTGGDVTPPRA